MLGRQNKIYLIQHFLYIVLYLSLSILYLETPGMGEERVRWRTGTQGTQDWLAELG